METTGSIRREQLVLEVTYITYLLRHTHHHTLPDGVPRHRALRVAVGGQSLRPPRSSNLHTFELLLLAGFT